MIKAARTLGLLFLVLGLIITGFGMYVVGVALHEHALQNYVFYMMIAGIFVAVFGALIYPSSGAGPAFQTITVAIGQLPFFGGRRSSDTASAVVVSTTTDKAPPLKQEGSP